MLTKLCAKRGMKTNLSLLGRVPLAVNLLLMFRLRARVRVIVCASNRVGTWAVSFSIKSNMGTSLAGVRRGGNSRAASDAGTAWHAYAVRGARLVCFNCSCPATEAICAFNAVGTIVAVMAVHVGVQKRIATQH